MLHSYCLNSGYGTRTMPEGTVTGAHFVKVVNDQVSYVQVTGSGDVCLASLTAGKSTKSSLWAVHQDFDPCRRRGRRA